eukprot:g4306.t1
MLDADTRTAAFPSVRQVWPDFPGQDGAFAAGAARLPASYLRAAHRFRAFPYNDSMPEACRYTGSGRSEAGRLGDRHDHIAIVMADNRDRYSPRNSYHYWAARAYTAYAKTHGYDFVYVQPKPPEGHALRFASSSWQKLYALEQLMSPQCKYQYLFVVDSDSYLARPTVRLEALLERLGLFSETADTVPPYVMAAATEWPEPDHLQGGFLNGGLTVWRCSTLARRMLKHWISYRELCGNSCSGTDGSWPHEQFSLGHWLLPHFRKHIATPLAGCPLGSAWGDFYVHLVSGVVHSAAGCGDLFDARPRERHFRDRTKFLRHATRCIEEQLALFSKGHRAGWRCAAVPPAPPCPDEN